MSNDHPLLGDWRAQGRQDKLDHYEQVAAANAEAKQRILDSFSAAIDCVAELDGVAASERARVGDELRRARRQAESSDLSPHPAAIDQRFAEEAA